MQWVNVIDGDHKGRCHEKLQQSTLGNEICYYNLEMGWTIMVLHSHDQFFSYHNDVQVTATFSSNWYKFLIIHGILL